MYLLNDPSDWDAFEQAYIIKTTAERSYELGRLADPNQFAAKRIPKPKKPVYEDYLARVLTPGSTRSESPAFSRGDRAAESYNELLPEDQEAFKAELNLYRMDREEYIKQNDGIRNVLNWMIEKINPHYVQTCSPAANESDEHDNISLFFLNLKAACGIDENLRRKQARQRYFEVLKEASNLRNNWEEWITKWEKTIRLAKLRKVAEAQHPNTWFEDLQLALENAFKIFIRIESSQYKAEIENGTYSPLLFSAHFRREIQDGKRKAEKEKPDRVAKGSFGPTFRASSSESTKRTASGPPSSRESSAKRPRQSIESGEKCKLCEKMHKKPNTVACWVAFPESAPPKFAPTQKQLDIFDQRVEQNKEVRELFERLQNESRNSTEKSS